MTRKETAFFSNEISFILGKETKARVFKNHKSENELSEEKKMIK